LPEGWVVDGEGHPVTDPHEGNAFVFQRAEGGITPLGGTEDTGSAKGYGLAAMVHILGGALVGASFSPIRNRTAGKNAPHNIGHFFMALDPKAFRDADAFEADLDDVIDELHATPPASPDDPVLVAGEPEDRIRAARMVEGIPVPDSLDKLIRGICDRCGAAYVLRKNA
jgi:LDH2 family malate/lactate/ureidoglycolate dehydrogenase